MMTTLLVPVSAENAGVAGAFVVEVSCPMLELARARLLLASEAADRAMRSVNGLNSSRNVQRWDEARGAREALRELYALMVSTPCVVTATFMPAGAE